MNSFGATVAACALTFCFALSYTAQAQRIDAEPNAPGSTQQFEPFPEQPAPNSATPDNATPDSPAPVRAAPARRAGARYFIEFRSRSALSYGHTFVVFGRVGERITGKNVAGLHPKGDSSITYLIGHIIPVPSETGVSDGDLDPRYTTARYRVMLSAAQYHDVVAKIRHLQEHSPAWNAATYNCNAFAGTIAHFAGLISPPTWLLPEDFINSMRRMNDPAENAMARHTRVR